jgi:hypothetical protein
MGASAPTIRNEGSLEMSNHETILAILDAERGEPYGDTASFKLGYLILMLASIADHHPDVAAELQDRLKSLKGK